MQSCLVIKSVYYIKSITVLHVVLNNNIIFSGIPPHVDTPGAFEDGIMSLSLLSQVKVKNTCTILHIIVLMWNIFFEYAIMVFW